MDAIALLIADHNRVRGLFAQFDLAKESGEAAVAAELAATITEELRVHTTIEEEIFYPWAHRLSAAIAASVDEGLEEHGVVKTLLAAVPTLDPMSDEWLAKMTVVIESVEHHAGEEETEMFPAVRGATSASERKKQAELLEARKATLGAPIVEDKIELTTDVLRKLASAQQIPGRSTMSHDELAATVAPQ